MEKVDDFSVTCRNWKAFESCIGSSGAHGYQLQIVSCVEFPLYLLNCRYNTELYSVYFNQSSRIIE